MNLQVLKCFCFYVELKLAVSHIETSEGSDGSSSLPKTITSRKSLPISGHSDEYRATNDIRRMEEALTNKDREVEALKVGFIYSSDIQNFFYVVVGIYYVQTQYIVTNIFVYRGLNINLKKFGWGTVWGKFGCPIFLV